MRRSQLEMAFALLNAIQNNPRRPKTYQCLVARLNPTQNKGVVNHLKKIEFIKSNPERGPFRITKKGSIWISEMNRLLAVYRGKAQ